MKNFIIMSGLLFFVLACQNNRQTNQEPETVPVSETNAETIAQNTVNQTGAVQTDGYALMKQFCFNCHMETPDPSKHDQMIAPPMANVKQHYISTYPAKDEFIQAVVSWVNKPDQGKVLMPGAVRHFNLMPPLPIGDDKLKAIAEALYNKDFDVRMRGNGHGKGRYKMMGGKLQLNNGKKWKLTDNDFIKMQQIQQKLQQSDLKNVQAYRQLGKDVFNNAKTILLNKNYNGKTLQQIQSFFHDIEGDMHQLMSVQTVEDGKKYQQALQQKFSKFNRFFE